MIGLVVSVFAQPLDRMVRDGSSITSFCDSQASFRNDPGSGRLASGSGCSGWRRRRAAIGIGRPVKGERLGVFSPEKVAMNQFYGSGPDLPVMMPFYQIGREMSTGFFLVSGDSFSVERETFGLTKKGGGTKGVRGRSRCRADRNRRHESRGYRRVSVGAHSGRGRRWPGLRSVGSRARRPSTYVRVAGRTPLASWWSIRSRSPGTCQERLSSQ